MVKWTAAAFSPNSPTPSELLAGGVVRVALGQASVEEPPVVISEILYHPASEDCREEFIELTNLSLTEVSMAGWRLSGGVRFSFGGEAVLAAEGRIVVVADLTVFQAKYPGVTNAVGNWAGILGNGGDSVELEDATGERVDWVTYADEGDWAQRWRGPIDRSHRGVMWVAAADGFGSSLELIQPRISNDHGQNWASSLEPGGTPGLPNSVGSAEIAPLVLEATHFPAVPSSGETVAVTVRLVDEAVVGLSARLYWRVDQADPGEFRGESMLDNGLREDGAAGDGVFGVILPPQVHGAVVEFYIEAADAGGRVRYWPGPVVEDGGVTAQSANVLYQVADGEYRGNLPLYRLVLTGADYAELYRIGHSGNGEQNSDAQFNASFISVDGGGTRCRYLVGVRNRGHGSRSRQPNNFRVNFRSDDRWRDVVAMNINGQRSGNCWRRRRF